MGHKRIEETMLVRRCRRAPRLARGGRRDRRGDRRALIGALTAAADCGTTATLPRVAWVRDTLPSYSTVKKPPETWFWSHDIKATQIASVVMPGTRLIRLSSYGEGSARRFAALVYKDAGPARSYAIDLDAAALAARVRDTGTRPVAITADTAEDDARFSVVFETGPGPMSSVHVDLDAAALCGLIDDRHGIADLATYVAGGRRRFAAIVEERSAPSWLVTGVGADELDDRVLELEAALVRVRRYLDAGVPRFAAVMERAHAGGSWAWYADLDGDGVARALERHAAYPIDLDAARDDRGVRFTVLMVHDRER